MGERRRGAGVALHNDGQSRFLDRRRRQRRRHPRSAALRRSGHARAPARGRRRHAARRHSRRHYRHLPELVSQSTLLLAQPASEPVGRRAAATLPAGARHGRGLERDGIVGAARAALRLRFLARGRRRRLGLERCAAMLPHARGRCRSRLLPVPSGVGRRQRQERPGSYPIRRLPAKEWPAFVTAMEGVAAARGLPRLPTSTKVRTTASFRCRSARMHNAPRAHAAI